MKWQIPAKTFLLGEYAALSGEAAILLTTAPCFELSLVDEPGLWGIHQDSPAGVWWRKQKHTQGLKWHDPYNGCGGLGASSAQFLGSYLASCHLHHKEPDSRDMLESYYEVAWSGVGIQPSGYDVLAQSQSGCVYINKKNNETHSFPWVFEDLSFTLLHTGMKLATHTHLSQSTPPEEVATLSSIAKEAKNAFRNQNSPALINAVNAYHQQLMELHLVAEHTLALIDELRANYPEILAIKGCGAMGADVILLISNKAAALHQKLQEQNHRVIATEQQLYLL